MMTERRKAAPKSSSSSAATLVDRWLQSAERQLLDAREDLKAARRRVVQLEDVVGSWKGFASEIQGAAPR